jgi:hypothetical protein
LLRHHWLIQFEKPFNLCCRWEFIILKQPFACVTSGSTLVIRLLSTKEVIEGLESIQVSRYFSRDFCHRLAVTAGCNFLGRKKLVHQNFWLGEGPDLLTALRMFWIPQPSSLCLFCSMDSQGFELTPLQSISKQNIHQIWPHRTLQDYTTSPGRLGS